MSNIIYERMWFNNGFAYHYCDIPLNNQGIVLLRGLNIDDGGFLGAGKTSPFEIFAQLQVGKSAKSRKSDRVKAADVVNIQTGGNFEAHLLFSVDGKKYEIVQYRNHSTHNNAYKVIELSTGRNVLPNKVRAHAAAWTGKNIIGIDERSLFSLVYLPQDYNNTLLTGTDSERQQSLMHMFSLDVYDSLLNKTKEKLVEAKVVLNDASRLERELEDIEAAIESFGSSAGEMAKELAKFRNEANRLKEEFDIGTNRLERLQLRLQKVSELTVLTKEVEEILKNTCLDIKSSDQITEDLLNQISNKYKISLAEIEKCKHDLSVVNKVTALKLKLKNLPDARDGEKIQQDLLHVREKIHNIKNIEKPNAEKRLKLAEILRTMDIIEDDYSTLSKRWKILIGKKNSLETEVSNLAGVLKNDICPTCKRPFHMSTTELEETKNKLKKTRHKLANVSTEERKVASTIKLSEKYIKLKGQFNATPKPSKPLKNLVEDLNLYVAKEQELVTELTAADVRVSIEAQLSTLPKLDQKTILDRKKKVEKEFTLIQRNLSDAEEIHFKLEKMKDLPSGNLDQIRKMIRKTKLKLARLQESKTEADRMVGRLGANIEKFDELETRKRKIVSGLAKLAKIRQQAICLEYLKKAFGAKGLKHIRFESILTEAVNHTVPKYSELLWPKRNVILNIISSGSSVKLAIDRKNGPSITSRLFSGGERNKAGLALLFGIRDLKEIYTGTKTNVLIVDEPFINLDPQGTGNLLRVLHNMKSNIGTIIVIGNQRDVFVHENMFDQTWWAVRENHTAKLYRNGLPEKYKETLDKAMFL